MDDMSARLSDLPPEIILTIGSDLSMRDLNSLVRTATRFYAFLSSPLYSLGAAKTGATTPLVWAVENRHLSVVARLLEKGADPARTVGNDTAFHRAVIGSKPRALELLLRTGVSPFVRDISRHTPLWLAVRARGVVMLCLILNASPARYPDENGDWAEALTFAVSSDHILATRCLLEAAAKTVPLPAQKAHQQTILLAVHNGSRRMVELLVDFGWNHWGPSNAEAKTPLHVAAERGHLQLIELLLVYGPKVNATDSEGCTPLHRAVLNATTQDDGNTALHVSAANNGRNIVQLLLNAGADVNIASQFGYTPLHAATQGDDISMVELLIEHGADIMATTQTRKSPLYTAADHGNSEIVNCLLSRGAHIGAEMGGDMSPLYVASRMSHVSLIQPLVDAGFDINCRGWAPLLYATNHDDLPTMRELIRCGADVNYTSPDGNSILHVALSSRREDALKLLLGAGANVTTPKINGSYILHEAALRKAIPTNIQLLIDHGANVNAVKPNNQTALHTAAGAHSHIMIPCLLSAGISIDARDNLTQTALHIAVRTSWEVTEALLKGGADVNARTSTGSTPLHIAAPRINRQIYDLLILAGADIIAKDNVDRTPLHIAVASSNKELFRNLLDRFKQKGLDCMTQSARGLTLVEEAAMAGSRPFLQMLAAEGVDVTSNNLQDHGQHRGTPALHLAVIYNNPSAAGFLINRGADPHYLDAYGRSAMDWAATLHEPAAVLPLLHRHNFYYAPTDPETRESILKTSVIGLAKRMLSGDTSNFYKLGKCLQYLGNIPAAATLYAQALICCNRCKYDINKFETSLACTLCPEVHLCSLCMASFHQGHYVSQGCSGHAFLELILADYTLPGQEKSKSDALKESRAKLLTDLIALYSQ